MPRERAQVQMNGAAWKVVGASGATFGVLCLAGVGAVVALEGDALATVALVLAIIAFVLQILMFVIQGTASRESAARSEQTYTDTSNALREIKSKAESNEAVLISQSDRLLNAVLALLDGRRVSPSTSAPAEAIGVDDVRSDLDDDAVATAATDEARMPTPPDPTDVARAVLQQLQGGPSPRQQPPRPEISEESRKIIARLRTYPSADEARPLVEQLKALTPLALVLLGRYASMEESLRKQGRPIGLTTANSPGRVRERDELIERGLVQNVGDGLTSLTDKGREVARLLRGTGEPEPAVREMLDELR